jgi:hypothetical protein
MTRRPRLLLAAAGLFTAWIAYLAYLALTASHPTVLSRPQFLVADVWIVGRVDDLDKPVEVVDVMYVRPELKNEAPDRGASIEVSNLARCESVKPGERYILPLSREGKGYHVTPVPRSPGYSPAVPPVRIYADTPEARSQLDQLPRPAE